MVPPIETLGVTPVGDMKYIQFNTLQSRERSFRDWPKQLSQKPNELSLAGFFYTGKTASVMDKIFNLKHIYYFTGMGDRVLCFQCGGGLKDWDPKDSPWIEHAKWFEKCPYLAIKKGKDYISHVNRSNYKEPSSSTVADGQG
jgi:baculoviral IAP repeat-containing protein 7/8